MQTTTSIHCNVFYYEMALAASLFPFLYTLFYSDYIEAQCISFLIIINGSLCHVTLALSCKYKHIFIYNDVLSNIIFTAYINLTTLWQPYTLIVSIIMLVTYVTNKYMESLYSNNIINYIAHSVFVQGCGFVGLLHYNKQTDVVQYNETIFSDHL